MLVLSDSLAHSEHIQSLEKTEMKILKHTFHLPGTETADRYNYSHISLLHSDISTSNIRTSFDYPISAKSHPPRNPRPQSRHQNLPKIKKPVAIRPR
jgi:hypothetical protein